MTATLRDRRQQPQAPATVRASQNVCRRGKENGKQETGNRRPETGHRVRAVVLVRGGVCLVLAVRLDVPRIRHRASTSTRTSCNT